MGIAHISRKLWTRLSAGMSITSLVCVTGIHVPLQMPGMQLCLRERGMRSIHEDNRKSTSPKLAMGENKITKKLQGGSQSIGRAS